MPYVVAVIVNRLSAEFFFFTIFFEEEENTVESSVCILYLESS